MNTVTFIRPEKDNVETVLSDWAGIIQAGCRGSIVLSLVDLKGSMADRVKVEQSIENSDVILYFGHGTKHAMGNPDALLDHANIYTCAGKILISVACETALDIGPEAINNNTRTFLGFDDELVVYLGKPGIFGSVFVQALLPLLTGSSSVMDSKDKLVTLFQTIEKHYRTSSANDPDAAIIWLAAHINWRGIQGYGDMNARI